MKTSVAYSGSESLLQLKHLKSASGEALLKEGSQEEWNFLAETGINILQFLVKNCKWFLITPCH